jgi:hypothetical protein
MMNMPERAKVWTSSGFFLAVERQAYIGFSEISLGGHWGHTEDIYNNFKHPVIW